MREQLGIARKVIIVGETRCVSKINTSFCFYVSLLFLCEVRYFGKISLHLGMFMLLILLFFNSNYYLDSDTLH